MINLKDYFFSSPDVFGLDISDLSLKIAKLKKRGEFFDLVSFGDFPVEEKIIEKGEIKDQEGLANTIKTALLRVKGETLKTNKVIVSLPEEKAFLKVISMPRMAEEELAAAIRFEAENHVPIPTEEVYLDFKIVKSLSNHQDRLDVLLSAFPKSIIDLYLQVLGKAGLKTQALEIESQATARALIANQIAPSPVLIIDLGANSTSLAIYYGRSLRFTDSLPLGGQTFTRALTNNLGVDVDRAELIKRDYGLTKKINGRAQKELKEQVENGVIFDCFIPVLTDLIEQIKKYLTYYQTHANGHHQSAGDRGVEKVLLCGGGAILKGLEGFLHSQFKMPVELGNPWVNILPQPTKRVPLISFEESLKYTTVLGLALRGAKNEDL